MSTPLSIQKIVREKYLAEEKSDEVLSANVRGKTVAFNSSVYGQIGCAPGSIVLGYTPDTASLDIEEWGVNTTYKFGDNFYKLGEAKMLRGDSRHKLKTQTLEVIDTAYQRINAGFARCIPNEHPDGFPRVIIRMPDTGMSISAHDFRFAGDVAGTMIFGRLKSVYRRIIDTVLGPSLSKWIPYLAPQKSTTIIINPKNKTVIDGITIDVDIKGNKVVLKDDTVDKDVL